MKSSNISIIVLNYTFSLHSILSSSSNYFTKLDWNAWRYFEDSSKYDWSTHFGWNFDFFYSLLTQSRDKVIITINQYGLSTVNPVMTCPYKARIDWYWRQYLDCTNKALSSPYSANIGSVLVANTEPVV